MSDIHDSNSVSGAAKSSADAVRRAAGEVGADLRSTAEELRDETLDHARTAAEEGKNSFAERLERLAGAISTAASDLKSTDPWASKVADSAAKSVKDASAHFHGESISEIANEASDFARRHPAIFLGGAIAMGMAMARLSKAHEAKDAPHHAEDMQ